jgi:hypothetical protein
MELQDEKDKNSVFLMGSTGTEQDHEQRQSSKLPLTHFTKTQQSHNNAVISLDSNCLSHTNTMNNEATVKAFKMACLSYRPSQVQFEKALYTRGDLIESK